MSSMIRGWLVFAVMLVGAVVAVALVASALESYETRSHDPDTSQALQPSNSSSLPGVSHMTEKSAA
jgi:hypothetical protein